MPDAPVAVENVSLEEPTVPDFETMATFEEPAVHLAEPFQLNEEQELIESEFHLELLDGVTIEDLMMLVVDQQIDEPLQQAAD